MTKMNTNYYSNLSDLELRNIIISGNTEAVEYLICEKCVSIIEYHWRKLLLNTWEFDESINDVCILLLEEGYLRLKKYKGHASLKTYISIIVYHYFLKEAIKEQKWRERKYTIDIDIEEKMPVESIDTDEKIRVEKTIKRMPNKRYKFILYKTFYENKKPNEIAEELDISIAVYYNKFRLAKKQFEQVYYQYYGN